MPETQYVQLTLSYKYTNHIKEPITFPTPQPHERSVQHVYSYRAVSANVTSHIPSQTHISF